MRRIISSILIFTLLSTLAPTVKIAEALSVFQSTTKSDVRPGGGLEEIRSVDSVETRYGLVAILVDASIWENSESYDGLTGTFSFSDQKLSERIIRYAEDIQGAVPWTKTMIITVDDEDTTVEIQETLERLYYEGDPDDSDTTKLSGLVVVGEIPLPVVTKSGHKFISMLPYTDFENPSYILNSETQDFERNSASENLQADIWHGLIIPPIDGEDGNKLLAQYFDKNHYYHTGEEDYTTFDKKTFVGDLETEGATINEVSFASYDRFLSYWEELAYYRYSNSWLEEIYVDMADSVEAGDGLDNDSDGVYDEEASNGEDEDGDGLIDEDLGDGFFGIDNDGDGQIDEDSFEDNNNDIDYPTFYLDDDVPFYLDRIPDEDPPGDANGDGCPGLCGKDDNGNSIDHDEDGFPSAIEAFEKKGWNDKRWPWADPVKFAKDFFGVNPSNAEEAAEMVGAFFIDENYEELAAMNSIWTLPDRSCYEGSTYHPEWDDDEDGYCDEDGSTETMDNGCVYNDADCDGLLDEDPAGMPSDPAFDQLPDIQSKKLIDSLLSRYVDIFEQPQGVWNRIVNGTGRYSTRYQDEAGNIKNDYDSAVSLIAKKDEAVVQYLRAVNDVFEESVNDMAENLQQDIPVVAYVKYYGTYTLEPADEEDEPEPVDLCDPDASFFNNPEDQCVQFINHIADALSWENAADISLDWMYMWGERFKDITSVKQCSETAGTYEDGGRFVQKTGIFSRETEDVDSVDQQKRMAGCFIANASNYLLDEDPLEICFPAVAIDPVTFVTGAKKYTDDLETTENEERLAYEKIEQGAPACFEFRELDTYQIYYKVNKTFSDRLIGEMTLSETGELSDEEWLARIYEIMDNVESDFGVRPTEATLKKHFDEIPIYEDGDAKYTVRDFFTELGYGSEYSDEELDVIMAYENGEQIENPSEGRNMDDIAELDIEVERKYMNADKNGLTEDLDDAFKMSSIYKYDEPNNDTLNAQIQDGAVPNLPIDATRRVTFLDGDEQYKELEYINVFDADSAADVEEQIAELSSQMAEVDGGSAYVDDVENFMDELNLAQLEDAFAWRDMNIDEKHKYVFSHYIGDEEAITSEVASGYEIVSVISKGDANNMYFAFNGLSPATDGDLEWQYRSQEAIEAALAEASSDEEETYEPLTELEGTTPVGLFEWIDEMQIWLEETEDSLSSFDTDGGELVCGDALELGAESSNEDADASGVPDAADETVSVYLTSEDNNVLQANGDDYYVVTASARKSDGSVNSSDNYTEINMAITSGSDSIEVSGNDTLKLTAGVATFLLRSKDAGDFTIKGQIENRDIADTNSLSGSVTSKYVKVSSFVIDDATSSESVTTSGDNIEVSDDEGNIIAVLNTVSGDLELRDAEAALVEADSDSPTKISITKDEKIYAYFYVIPDNKKVFVGDGGKGVYVSVVDSNYSAEKVETGVALMSGTSQVGLVSAYGQIAVGEGLYLNFSNPGEINIFDPILISNSSGETLFAVTIKSKDKDFELLGFLKKLIKPAFAAEISDTDADNLDDLEEWTIGTDPEDEDSDNDGYNDGVEVFTGYDPLNGDGGKLFSDVGSTHEAYSSIVTLYLRGILNGYNDGTFRPDSALTREEFMKIDLGSICVSCTSFADDYLSTLMSLYGADPFPDTNINGELLACVAEGKTREIVSGYKSGEWLGYFLPERSITRAEATKVLLETAGYSAEDATSGAWYSNYAALAESMDIFPAGDFADNLEEEITRGEFAMMAVNLLDAKDCRDTDSDGDGLSDAEEDYRYGTDKNLADTDNGGVNDFDEIVRGSDPLDASDDIPEEIVSEEFDLSGFDHDSGVFGEGSSLSFEEIASSLELDSQELKQFTDEVPADGESIIYVQAEIRDQDGNVYVDDNLSVIEFLLSSREYGDLVTKRVQVSSGKAETVFRSETVAGEVEIVARISDGSLPSQDTLVNVYAGEASSLEIDAESTIIPVGGESVDDIQINLYDDFGNLANYGFHTVTVVSEGGIEVLDLSDEDPETEGTQVSTSEGFIKFRILSSETAETSTLRASIVGKDESGYSIEIESIEGMQLALSKTKSFLIAGGSGVDEITVSVTDASGNAISEFQGDVDLTLSDPGYGTFAESTLSLNLGTARTRLIPGTLAGSASILANSNGISGGSLTMEFKPADPYELQIRKDDGTTVVEAGEAETFYVEAFDQYGNVVSNDSSTTVDLRMTDATEEFGRLGRRSVKLNQGSASFRVDVQDISGKLNLVAASTGLVSGSFGGEINYGMGSDEFRDINPEMLFGSFLGGPYGDVTQEDYIGGWLTFNGKTQALTTLIQEPTPKERVATIGGNGAVSLSEGSILTQSVSAAGASLPMRISWRSFPEDVLQAETIFVLPSAATYTTATLLTASSDFSVEAHEGGYLLREDEAGVVKIRSDGQIEILDSNYNIAVSGSSDGLAFVVSKATQQVLHVEYEDVWASDVSLLDDDFDLEDWATLSSGIYIRPTAATENYFVATPSGNSSESPMGMALIDPEKDLPDEMQPSLGYQSLENAVNDGSVGWENENKHLLLFSAGNTVGESNLYYTSEVGVVLGDPTVTLTTENEANAAGFTKDVGKMVYTSEDDILTLMNIDYNGDELEDVLIAYEDGRIDVLQNNKSPNRLNNRGTILQLENGISSIDKGEFNGDDLEDLLVVTDESCLADEMCLYVFENIDGGFVSSNLTFEAIDSKPKQVEVADLNNDELDDLVVLSENLGLYVIWNRDGTFENGDVVELKDFGLNVDSGQNLFADISLHYDGLDEGSLTLPVPSRGFSSNAVDTNLTGVLNAILSDNDYETESGDIESKVNKEFEYAENLSDSFEITKTLSDADGGNLNIGDEINVEITVKNIGTENYENIYLSDKVSGSFTFDSTQNENFSNTGDVGRPAVYGSFDLNSGEETTITYELELEDLPKMYIMLAHDFYSDYKDDNYIDVAVSPEGNTTGTLLVFYSDSTSTERTGILSNLKTVNYKEQEYTEEAYTEEYDSSVVSEEFEIIDEDGNDVPDAFDEMDAKKGVPVNENNRYFMEEVMGASDADGNGFYAADEYFVADDDLDNDGLNDMVDSWQNSASAGDMLLTAGDTLEGLGDGIAKLDSFVSESADKIENIVSMFTCNGGCVAFSSSIAFLAPGTFHEPFTGITVGMDTGTPIFGVLPAPAPPVVCFGQACYASQTFRIYLAPTTTLGIGLGICVGVYGAGQCWAFNIPLLQLLGVCDAINGFVADTLSKATSFATGDGNQAFNIKAEGSAGGSGIESDTFDGYEPPVATSANIQIPGFPSIFTEWWKRQKNEFYKMLDLPDIIFIYPDPNSIKEAFSKVENNPVLELETNIFGLEKFLNFAHSLPIVDIDTEKVFIKYPALTPEEIELTKKDWEAWIEDTKAEFEAFKESWVPVLDADVSADISAQFEGLIAAMENNMEVLDSYGRIPEEILKIREIEAYYAKTIICYLDAILGFTAGYLTENVERIEAWAKWVKDLEDIVATWQGLFKISSDMMESCDKCTNQRYSGFQLLASLFVFIPDLPVIEMPKLPDIVIDTSNIQAGVDIIWPDVVFVPESLNIPKIPRITLPRASITIDADISAKLSAYLDLNIPTLPEFEINFEIPELPGLALPDLPDVPPAPALPEIDSTLSASLNIVSTIIRVICIIRQGFIPTNEMMLKSKIEEITERPGSILLPTDLLITTEFPSFSFDFFKRIEINTYLNLTTDFTLLYDLIKGLGDESNEFIQNFIDQVDEGMQSTADSAQEELDTAGDEEIDVEVEVDAEAEADVEAYNDAQSVANNYVDHPLVHNNILLFQRSLENLQSSIKNWDPGEDVKLVAGERILALDDPLLHNYDNVSNKKYDAEFIAGIQNTPLAGIANMRDSLIAKVENIENGNRILANSSGEKFYEYLAMEYDSSQYNLAESSEESISSGDLWDFGKVEESKDIEVDFAAEEESNLADATAVSFNEGLYIYNEELGISERLTQYAQEANKAASILFVDLDNDDDQDIIYSSGGDVYIKENHTEEANLKYVSDNPNEAELDDLVPVSANIKNLKRGENNNEESNFSFSASDNTIAYDISLYDSLDAIETAEDENVKRLLLMASTENDTFEFGENETSISVDENLDYGEPTLRTSRLLVKNESGSNKLYNGYERTIIESDGELSIGDAVTLQTLEDSQIEVRVEDGTATMNFPANTLIKFPRKEERTIRLESGRAIWVGSESVYEQDLIEGMEIFKEEIINLESGSADVTLESSEGAEIELDNEELFIMEKLINAENPTSQVELENGAYYVVARALKTEGYATRSDNILLNPQICADDSAPYPLISEDEIDVAIFSTKDLSAESSFDTDSDIVDAYWDLDDSVDVDGDGVLNNDEEVIGLTAEVGPYEDADQKTATLWVTDTAGNEASATVLVNIYIPDITISSATTEEVDGTTSPLSPEFPFHLVRERSGTTNEIGNGYVTDEEGNFALDMDGSDLINVYDENNAVIARFNPATKQLLVYDDDYEALALESGTEWPSRLVVAEIASGAVMASFLIVSEGDEIKVSSKPLEEMDLADEINVTVYEASDSETFVETEEGYAIQNEFGVDEFIVKKDGNISFYDTRFELVKREATSLDEYLVLELYSDEELVLEIYPGSPENVTITTTDALGLPASEAVESHDSLSADTRLYFEDIDEDDELFEEIGELVERGVLEGYEVGGKRYFKPDQEITRAEFTKIILAILCIVPRDEAYDLPAVFTDITSTSLWYFPFTKEGYLRDLITGYLGEVNSEGDSPFKPSNTINRAEAAKIVLEALDKEGIINLPEVSGSPWYAPYMVIAEDISEYLVSESIGEENFILTADEAADPTHEVTRYEFVEMSVRVLQAYNCFDLDSDGDTLINYDEESKYGSDAYNPDTDGGGVDDGTEVNRGSDPLDPEDDFPTSNDLGLEPGIYAVQEPCISCPCLATIDYDADLRAGDSVFAIIQNEAGEIFGISNKVEITE